ncbi:MAG TPA: hypothetical protein VEU53_07855 [Stellaceae bacterium]|nr:hypothetical protein [Stellaceae bacterium]
MVGVTGLGAALAAFERAKNIAQSMMALRDAAAFQGKMIEFQSAIIDAQNSAIAANEERAALIEKVGTLEAQVAKLEAWETEKKRYQLESLPPGVFVLTLRPEMANGEPPHHICQTCYQRGKKSILHSDEPGNGIYHLACKECGATLTVGHFRAPRIDYGRYGPP